MAEEMMLENVAWESDEAEDFEADEALAEAEDSFEDIGERARRRRRRRSRGRYRPGRGVRGMVVRGPDGRARNMQFPEKLATADETNKGLASQEVARRALEERFDKLEARLRLQQKKDSGASGLVSLAIGVPLSAWGLTSDNNKGSSKFGNWASAEATKMAAMASATQLATSGAKMIVNGHYHRSGIGIAADIFAAAQLAAFTFGSLYKPDEPEFAGTKANADANINKYRHMQLVLTKEAAADSPTVPWRVIAVAGREKYLVKAQDLK